VTLGLPAHTVALGQLMAQGSLKTLEKTAEPMNRVLAPLTGLRSKMSKAAGVSLPCPCPSPALHSLRLRHCCIASGQPLYQIALWTSETSLLAIQNPAIASALPKGASAAGFLCAVWSYLRFACLPACAVYVGAPQSLP